MKHNLLDYIFFLSIFFWIGLLQADGFVIGTQVLTEQGLMPIEQCTVGNQVVAYENQKIYTQRVSYTTHFAADYFVQVLVDDEYIYADIDQKFYVINKGTWVNASQLQPSDTLLCINGKCVIESLKLVCQPCQIHVLSVETKHTFCVGRHGIVVHNIEPGSTTTAVLALSTVCPPAAAVVAVAEIVALGVVSVGMYCTHKKLEKNKKTDGCFSQDDVLKHSQNAGCYTPDIPYIHTLPSTPGCTITVEKPRTAETIPYEKPEGMNDVYTFPIEVVRDSIMHQHDTNRDGSDEKKQYNGPWYNRTEDWMNEHPFGQKIKKSLERSQYTNQGKRAFKVIENIENCDGFKKGDYIVIDAMHKDHLEVFDKRGRWVRVTNFDGTKNDNKTWQGEKEFRGPLE